MARKIRRLSDLEQKEIQDDFKNLEQKIKVLRAEYNQYFIGSRKEQPNFTEATVRRIIRKYAGDGSLRGQDRFIYYNLVARYTTMREYWGRRLRAKETESGMIRSPMMEQVSRARQLRMSKQLRTQFSRTIRNPKEDGEAIRRLYVGYMRAARSVGTTSTLKLREFQTLLERQTENLQRKKSCQGVQFRIDVEDGRVRLRAKPEREE